MFYCREKELLKLEKRYHSEKFECIIIYGRRRVGKTSLINEFCKDKPTVFFSALDATSQENLKSLSKAIYTQNDSGAAAPIYKSYEDALDAISRRAAAERMVFVIDEYPYLAQAEHSISSRLQHLIDHKWKDSRLFLILCGSSMSFMEYQVLGYESPLYGRRTAQFKIEPLNYRETAVFNPTLSNEDNALLYGITGGVPHYINKLEIAESVDEALRDNLFEPSGYLFEEPGNLLKQELREPAVYNSIITAIAEGKTKLNEIAGTVGLETGPCSKYLKVLMDLGIVKKETPITEKIGKKSMYLIADNFFRFWYRFVPQNMTAIQSGRMEQVYEGAIKQYFSDYMGLIFEKMCQDYLLYYAEKLPFSMRDIGQWWGTDSKTRKQVQIDIVGTDALDNGYIVGSCKYRNELIGTEEYERLKAYAKVFAGDKTCYFYMFAKRGFTEAMQELGREGKVKLITLADLYRG